MRQKLMNNKMAVSPVVGTLLMLAITVALIAALWFFISGYTVNNYNTNIYEEFSHIDNNYITLPDNDTTIYDNDTIIYDNDTSYDDTTIINPPPVNPPVTPPVVPPTNDTVPPVVPPTNDTDPFQGLKMLILKFNLANKHKWIDLKICFKVVDWRGMNHIHFKVFCLEVHVFWKKTVEQQLYIYIYMGKLPTV